MRKRKSNEDLEMEDVEQFGTKTSNAAAKEKLVKGRKLLTFWGKEEKDQLIRYS